MSGTILVTLCGENWSGDYELPSEVELDKLYPLILEALKKTVGDAYQSDNAIALTYDHCLLRNPTATLSSYGIQTGDCLRILREKVL